MTGSFTLTLVGTSSAKTLATQLKVTAK